MPRLLLFFILGFVIQFLPATETTSRLLHIGMDARNAPLSFYDDAQSTVSGFDVEMAREACHRLGVEPVFVNTYWQRVFRDLQEHRIDLVWSGMALTPERNSLYRTSVPYHRTHVVVVVNRRSPVRSLEQLRGSRIGYLAGSHTGDILRRHPLLGPEIERERIRLIPHSSFQEGFMDLAYARADALAMEDYAVFTLSSLPPDKIAIRLLSQKLGAYDLSIAARPADSLLIRKLDSVLVTMENDGTAQKLRQIWFNPVFFQRLQDAR